MRFIKRTILVAFTLWYSTITFAKERNPWTHFGLRPLGMGNAFVSIADDYNALFYNPAGLARLKTWDFEFLNPQIAFSKEAKGLIEDATDISEVDDTLDLIEKNSGENQVFSFGLTPHFIMPNFGFAIGLDFTLSMIFHRDISVDVKSGMEIVAPIGFGMSFLDDRLSVGASVKSRFVGYVDREFSMEDIEAFSSDDNTDGPTLDDYVLGGTGVGADIGLLFTPTQDMEPTIGLSITDFAGTSFNEAKVSGDEPLGKPPIVLPSVNLGLSLTPIKANGSYLRAAIDMHSINQPYSFSQKLQMGVEYGLGEFFRVQGGLYKGYATAGIQLDAGLINFKFVTYAEEIGSVAGYKPSRRFAVQFKLLI